MIAAADLTPFIDWRYDYVCEPKKSELPRISIEKEKIYSNAARDFAAAVLLFLLDIKKYSACRILTRISL